MFSQCIYDKHETVKIMKINEKTLRKIVRNVIMESFGNSELAEYVQEHGGLMQKPRFPDARNVGAFDVRYAQPTGYFDPEVVEQMHDYLNCIYDDIAKQLLYTNDGGAIAVEDGAFNYPGGRQAWNQEVDNPYASKMYHRGKNFTEDNPEDRWGEKWTDKENYMPPGFYRAQVNGARTRAHQKNRGK